MTSSTVDATEGAETAAAPNSWRGTSPSRWSSWPRASWDWWFIVANASRAAVPLSHPCLAVGLAFLLAACASAPTGQRVALPSGNAGIGFDDLRYSSTLHRVLVPAGRTGTLDLVDPDTLAV